MTDCIRNLYLDEFEPFMRFLERCFGLRTGAFEEYYPHIYRPTVELCASAFVVEREGQILSHVGLYPIETVVHGITLPIGGIGAVATLHAERGQGYMSRLLERVIDEMRARGYVLSWLGGDRQRYGSFGWERAGLAYELELSRRALDRAGVSPVTIQGRYPQDALETVTRLHTLPCCHTRRAELATQLKRGGLWIWTAEDGYALARGSEWGPLSIVEAVSASGQEAGIVRAVLDWTGRDKLHWTVSAWEKDLLAHLLPGVSYWRQVTEGMYRIVDLAGLLSRLQPVLAQRAAPLRDFELTIAIRERDRADAATLILHSGELEVVPGRGAARSVEWSSLEAVRILIGGAPLGADVEVPPEAGALFPLPVHVPALDDC